MPSPGRQESAMTAGSVIRAATRTAARRLLETEPAAIDDLPDGVHQHRTHVRRLRSLLACFSGYLDESATTYLRVELGEWGGQLGIVRDAEVRGQVAAAAMDELGIADAHMRRRLVDAEREEYGRAHARLRELHDGPRSVARIAALTAFAADPPTTGAAQAGTDALTRLARREARRVRKAAKRGDGSLEALHELRKAGRRLRYVCEALHTAAPELFGQVFADLAAAGEEVHDTLGDHRDELIFLHRLEIVRARARRSGESVEPYDDLAARAAERAKHRLGELDDALARLRKAAKAL